MKKQNKANDIGRIVMLRLLTLSFALLCASLPQTRADDYPSRPIVIIVGLAAGGVSDVMTRFYADVV